MARPGLTKHRKFLRLARALKSEALALGHLELMWEAAYESGEDYLGEAADVEAVASWRGKDGALVAALLSAGGEGQPGFIEEAEGQPGRYRVHDLYDHAPEYVRKRMDREAARRAAGKSLQELRSEAGRLGGSKRKQMDAVCLPVASVCQANGTTPAPAPAPAPIPEERQEAEVVALAVPKPADLQALWNQAAHPDLPRWRDMTAKRAATAKARLAERPLMDPEHGWLAVINRISASDFCRGKNDRGWKAGPEFFLRPDTATKALEGAYDNRGNGGMTATKPARSKPWTPDMGDPYADPAEADNAA